MTALNDPIVRCCGRDAADCDCPPVLVGLDRHALYSADAYPGVALRVLGPTWSTEERVTCIAHDDLADCDEDCEHDVESEEVASDTFVRVMMVGDDRPLDVERDELRELAEGESCAECGQVGCTADGRSR